MRSDVITMRDNILLHLDIFFKEVHTIIINRDISERKLQNSAGLNIQLPEFRGYQSEMDIYFPFRI